MPDYRQEESPDRIHWISSESHRIGFQWTGDRWAHSIWIRTGGDWIRVASSLEHDPSPSSPGRVGCPAYQQFHYQEGASGAVAMLVGQAGPHHFSASFQFEERG